MTQLAILFLALVIGYTVKKLPISFDRLNKVLFAIVLLILLVMGYGFGVSIKNLLGKLQYIFLSVVIFSIVISLFNFVFISIVFAKEHKALRLDKSSSEKINFLAFILQSVKYLSIILLGGIIGIIANYPLNFMEHLINLLLVLLLFVVGHQMRMSGTSLKEVVFNKAGIKLSLTVVMSSLLAGIVVAFIIQLPITTALAMSSGFGWYTLSSILIGSLIKPEYSAISFFVDFNRELLAIIFLPSLGRLFPFTMVGICGATAMDFSFPVIKQNLGQQFVIVAISSGMLLSIAVPLLIPLFAKINL